MRGGAVQGYVLQHLGVLADVQVDRRRREDGARAVRRGAVPPTRGPSPLTTLD